MSTEPQDVDLVKPISWMENTAMHHQINQTVATPADRTSRPEMLSPSPVEKSISCVILAYAMARILRPLRNGRPCAQSLSASKFHAAFDIGAHVLQYPDATSGSSFLMSGQIAEQHTLCLCDQMFSA
jgi:hypothetical protein